MKCSYNFYGHQVAEAEDEHYSCCIIHDESSSIKAVKLNLRKSSEWYNTVKRLSRVKSLSVPVMKIFFY